MSFDTLLQPLHVVGFAVMHIERRVGVAFRDKVEAGVCVIDFIQPCHADLMIQRADDDPLQTKNLVTLLLWQVRFIQ